MQLELWKIMVLAVVQGVTEFLPVSSSGHLVIVAALLSSDGSTKELDVADLNIVMHIGTLLSIVIFYWRRILELATRDRRTVPLLVVASVPAALVGVPIELWFEHLLESPLLAGCLLPLTGAILLQTARIPTGQQTYTTMTFPQALTIGIAQAVAVFPGISRSGSTISTGMRLGLAPKDSATFSFLMAIIAIGGAGLIKVVSLVAKSQTITTPVSHLVIGAAIACVVGLGALAFLVRWLEKGRFQIFAWWCIAAGAGIVAWQLWRMAVGK